jgi:hypothetical protein
VSARQSELFEPTGAEVVALAGQHLAWGEKAARSADVFEARGMVVLAQWQIEAADDHYQLAGELAMLAQFEALGGVS